MKSIPDGWITEVCDEFRRSDGGENGISDNAREQSWDFCWSYFQSVDDPTADMERSCLQLGYYLASWGMLRGSSYLFNETNLRHYRPTIKIIAKHNGALKATDIGNYGTDGFDGQMDSAYQNIRHAILPFGG